MATTKSYSDLEQSRKLAEILPLESADMTWEQVTHSLTEDFKWKPTIGLDVAIKGNLFSYRNGYGLPCWSLAALLDVLPQYELNNFGDTIQLDVNLEAFATEGDETLLDLVVNMIIHLHEQNLL